MQKRLVHSAIAAAASVVFNGRRMTGIHVSELAFVRRYQRGEQRDESIGTEGGEPRRDAIHHCQRLEPVEMTK